MVTELKWYDPKDDHPQWIKALAEVRQRATREGWCYHHVQAIIVAIDQYAEAALGNRDFCRRCGFRPSARKTCFLTLGRASALGTSERNVRFGHLVVESPRYHES